MFTLGIFSGVLLAGIVLAKVRSKMNERPQVTHLMSPKR
jgi:hypothetical protein